MAKKRTRANEYGGASAAGQLATVIKLRGTVLVEDLENSLKELEEKEIEIEGELSQLIINNAKKTEIENVRRYLIRVDGAIETLIGIIEGKSLIRSLVK